MIFLMSGAKSSVLRRPGIGAATYIASHPPPGLAPPKDLRRYQEGLEGLGKRRPT
jgi:hypothetical protein